MSGSSKAGLPLSELRLLGIVDEKPADYKLHSWLNSAKHCANEAKAAEEAGREEDAFVGYLRALCLYQTFVSHPDYTKFKSDGVRHPLYRSVMEFLEHRSEYVDHAKILSERLKTRDIELPTENSSRSSSLPRTPPAQQTQQPVPPPSNQLTSPSVVPKSNLQETAEPDVAAGGSIAARLAALRGAGMNASTSNKRLSKEDGAFSAPAPAPSGDGDLRSRRGSNGSVQASSSATAAVVAGPGPSSRRGSAASINTNGYPAVGGNGGLGYPYTQNSTQLENNRTGSSFASIRSQGQTRSVRSGPDEKYSNPPSPALTPHPSGNVAPAVIPASTQQPPAPPAVSSHFHKSSLPNMPTPSAPNGYTPRPQENPTHSRLENLSSSGSATNLPADDDLAQFTSAFPSLVDFENSPDFSTPQEGGKRFGQPIMTGRPHTIEEADEEAQGLPKFPSPPKAAPGSSSLLIVDVPLPRPRSLPEPDTATGTTIAGAPVNGSYFPSPILEPQTRQIGLSSASPSSRDIPNLVDNMAKLDGTPPPVHSRPVFPFTNAVSSRQLKHYLNNSSVRVLLLDVREKEEYDKGNIAKDAGGGGSFDIAWIDPTLLDRPGIDSVKLENALSLSPSVEQKAFQNRAQYDLVVVYDASSPGFPVKGQKPNPMSRLYNLTFVDEFRKSLQRSPVALSGGYKAWQEEYQRSRSGSSSSSNPLAPSYGQNANGGRGPPPIPAKKPSLSGESHSGVSSPPFETKRLRRETTLYKPSPGYATSLADSFQGGVPQSMSGMTTGYTGRPLATMGSASSLYSSTYGSTLNGGPAPPPAAATHPGLSRRRSDYVEQHGQPYSGYTGHTSPRASSTEYPRVEGPGIPQPPPLAASPSLDRHDSRPRQQRSTSVISYDGLANSTADQVGYWNDVAVGMSGLKNLGNTCYMNSTLQCLSATYPLARFFLDGSYKRAINTTNPLGTKGDLAKAFSTLISMLWKESYTFLSPVTFRKSISTWAPSFAGSDQQDSQEFLSFLLDGLHEDLNRIRTKPPPVEMTPDREAALETLPPVVAADKEWQIYKMRNDSLIVDLFQGQYRNRMECLTCHKTSTTYDAFMYMSLPVPTGKTKVVLQQLIDHFVQTEIMEKAEAWNCPRCKVPRKATKSLSIARLPPVLLIHLKRFSTKNGVFWDKSETPVIFPVKELDLTRYMPPPDPGVVSRGNPDDPRSMVGPFKYDLFAVSNHMGSLSSGHYTAFVNSSKGWQYCDDSKISPASERDVVSKPAYILFYKRVQGS